MGDGILVLAIRYSIQRALHDSVPAFELIEGLMVEDKAYDTDFIVTAVECQGAIGSGNVSIIHIVTAMVSG